MDKKLDPAISAVLKKHGFGPDACWNCRGTWVVYHHVLEKIAAATDIVFDMPQILEANAGNKIASMVVSGRLEGRIEWATGEASPANCTNAYPWAMAEKRAKDRVILKLIGLAGLAYSEEEADEFKDSTPKDAPKQNGNPPGITKFRAELREFYREMHSCTDYDQYVAFVNTPDSQALLKRAQKEFPDDWSGDGGDIKGLKQDMTELVAQLKQ